MHTKFGKQNMWKMMVHLYHGVKQEFQRKISGLQENEKARKTVCSTGNKNLKYNRVIFCLLDPTQQWHLTDRGNNFLYLHKRRKLQYFYKALPEDVILFNHWSHVEKLENSPFWSPAFLTSSTDVGLACSPTGSSTEELDINSYKCSKPRG